MSSLLPALGPRMTRYCSDAAPNDAVEQGGEFAERRGRQGMEEWFAVAEGIHPIGNEHVQVYIEV